MQPDDQAAVDNQPSQSEVFWGYSDVFFVSGLLFAFVVVILGGVLGLRRFIPRLQTDEALLLLPIQIVFYLAIFLAFRIVFGIRYQKPVFSSLGWNESDFPKKWALFGGIALTVAVQGLLVLLKTPPIHSPLEDLMKSTPMLVVFGILAVTIAPLFEELIFRGFLQPLLVKTMGVYLGILIPALLFGVLHIFQYSNAWQSAAAISLVGLALGVVRYKGKSIIPSTLMHCAYNGILIFAVALEKFQHSK